MTIETTICVCERMYVERMYVERMYVERMYCVCDICVCSRNMVYSSGLF